MTTGAPSLGHVRTLPLRWAGGAAWWCQQRGTSGGQELGGDWLARVEEGAPIPGPTGEVAGGC